MLVIKIELWPYGQEANKKEIGRAIIGNNLTGDTRHGNYNVRIFTRGSKKRIWKRGKVKGFPRKRLTAWDLLYRALVPFFAERNKEVEDRGGKG